MNTNNGSLAKPATVLPFLASMLDPAIIRYPPAVHVKPKHATEGVPELVQFYICSSNTNHLEGKTTTYFLWLQKHTNIFCLGIKTLFLNTITSSSIKKIFFSQKQQHVSLCTATYIFPKEKILFVEQMNIYFQGERNEFSAGAEKHFPHKANKCI